MTIKMILAVDQGGAIGWSDGRLAYPGLKQDMARFKELTTGHTVVMGFNTFKSLGRPKGLPNRKNIVLTRKPWNEVRGFFDPASDIDIISNLDWVKRQADINRHRASSEWQDEVHTIWIIGGASVYEEALKKDLVDEIHLTLVHATSDADVRMTTDLVAWKRFVLTERKRGINWEVEPISRQRDDEVETSYITFTKK